MGGPQLYNVNGHQKRGSMIPKLWGAEIFYKKKSDERSEPRFFFFF